MAVGCGPKIAKLILFVFNVLFWLSGLVLIIVGAIFLANGSLKYIDQIISSSTNRNILILFIVIGVVIFAIGFCGCCGAIKESRCLLAAYILFLFAIIGAEVAFGIFVIVNKSYVQKEFSNGFNSTVLLKYGDQSNNTTPDPTIKTSIDNLQELFKCCGVNNFVDWKNSRWYSFLANKEQTVPESCCVTKGSSCWTNINSDTTYMDGCVFKINGYIKNNLPIVIGIALGIALFEIFVMICAFCLCRNTDAARHQV